MKITYLPSSAPNRLFEVSHRAAFDCQILARLAQNISWAASGKGDIEFP
jgi:hypothetical protein